MKIREMRNAKISWVKGEMYRTRKLPSAATITRTIKMSQKPIHTRPVRYSKFWAWQNWVKRQKTCNHQSYNNYITLEYDVECGSYCGKWGLVLPCNRLLQTPAGVLKSLWLGAADQQVVRIELQELQLTQLAQSLPSSPLFFLLYKKHASKKHIFRAAIIMTRIYGFWRFCLPSRPPKVIVGDSAAK